MWKGETPFDLVVSQFGLMFFADPVAVLTSTAANLRAARRLPFTCWRAPAENQWVTTPLNAIHGLLPKGPAPVPHAPGPFALADRTRLAGLLQRAGIAGIAIEPFDFAVRLACAGGVEPAIRLAMQVGPLGSALAEASDDVRAVTAQRLETVLAPHVANGEMTLGGAIRMVEAVADHQQRR